METVRDRWTDERLDDLNHRVEKGFDRVHADLRDLRNDLGGDIGSLRTEMNARFDALQRTLIQVGGGIAAAFGAALIGLIATQL